MMYRRYRIKDFSKEQALANIPAPGPSAVKEVGGLAGDGYMMGEYRDNISNIYLVIGSFGHLVIWSFGHWSLVISVIHHSVIISWRQSGQNIMGDNQGKR